MRDADFKTLEARWHELYSSYATIKAALPPVVRREWTNRKRYHPEPHYFLRQPPRGRVLEDAPTDNRHYYEYGFDAQGRVVIEVERSRYHGAPESYYLYLPDRIEMLTFILRKERRLPGNIVQCYLAEGRVQRLAGVQIFYAQIDPDLPYPAPGQVKPYEGKGVEGAEAAEIWAQLVTQNYAFQWRHEEYLYEQRRLTLIQGGWHTPPLKFTNNSDRFEYDAQKQLQRIVRTHWDGSLYVLYRRRKRGETLASITANAKQKLIESIPAMLAAAHLEEPLYCLNLYYSLMSAGDYFPPEFLPGFERDRQRKMQEHEPGRAEYYLWWYLWDAGEDDDPPEHVAYEPLEITDPDTLEACERLQVEVYMRDNSDLAVKTMYEICRELNKLDWTQYTAVTPDFIVYACDQTEHVAIADSLRLSGASATQIEQWRAKGMVNAKERW
jgi:hypothetical protein